MISVVSIAHTPARSTITNLHRSHANEKQTSEELQVESPVGGSTLNQFPRTGWSHNTTELNTETQIGSIIDWVDAIHPPCCVDYSISSIFILNSINDKYHSHATTETPVFHILLDDEINGIGTATSLSLSSNNFIMTFFSQTDIMVKP